MTAMTAMTDFLRADLPAPLERQIRRHCEQAYPYEACGALIGHGDGGSAPWQIRCVRPAPNQHPDDQRRRYSVPPAFAAAAEREAYYLGEDVLGYYHSHPEHPAEPSEYDRLHAWFGYLYLICSVHEGCSTEIRAFTLVVEKGEFSPVSLQASDSTHSNPEPL